MLVTLNIGIIKEIIRVQRLQEEVDDDARDYENEKIRKYIGFFHHYPLPFSMAF